MLRRCHRLLTFTWRPFAKADLRFVLPKIFRFLANISAVPNRRFYTPATDYQEVPMDSTPSVIDLPSQLGMEIDDENVRTSTGRSGRGGAALSDMKRRRNRSRTDFGQDVKSSREKPNNSPPIRPNDPGGS